MPVLTGGMVASGRQRGRRARATRHALVRFLPTPGRARSATRKGGQGTTDLGSAQPCPPKVLTHCRPESRPTALLLRNKPDPRDTAGQGRRLAHRLGFRGYINCQQSHVSTGSGLRQPVRGWSPRAHAALRRGLTGPSLSCPAETVTGCTTSLLTVAAEWLESVHTAGVPTRG